MPVGVQGEKPIFVKTESPDDMVSLQQWAENTVEEYKKMAAELGATAPAFYTQSNLLKLEGRPEVMECLKKAGYVYSPVWLGMKDFNRLVVDSVDDTADRLVEEIAKLVADLRRILPPASAENTASAGTSPRTL